MTETKALAIRGPTEIAHHKPPDSLKPFVDSKVMYRVAPPLQRVDLDISGWEVWAREEYDGTWTAHMESKSAINAACGKPFYVHVIGTSETCAQVLEACLRLFDLV